MGFGLLFAGYILLFFPIVYADVVCVVIGAVCMCAGLYRLRAYEKQFLWCFYLSVPGIVLNAFKSALTLQKYLVKYGGFPTLREGLDRLFSDRFSAVFDIGYAAFMFLFLALMLWGMFCIGREVQLMKIQVKSLRNLVITAVYYLLLILINTGLPVFGSYTDDFKLPILLLGYIWTILVALNIYSCYKWITVPELEEEQKSTLFGRALERAARTRHEKEEAAANAPATGKTREQMEKKNEKLRRRAAQRAEKENKKG